MQNRKWHWALTLAALLMLSKTLAAYALYKKNTPVPATEQLPMVDGPVSIPATLFSAFV